MSILEIIVGSYHGKRLTDMEIKAIVKEIRKAFAKGVDYFAAFYMDNQLKPGILERVCNEEGIELPRDLSVGYPGMNAKIREGATQEEIAKAGNVTRARARQYMIASDKYGLWLKKSAERKAAERQQRIELRNAQRQISPLEAELMKLADSKEWAVQKAVQYARTQKFVRYSIRDCIILFQRYETAKNKGVKMSLAELGKPLGMSATVVGYILKSVGLEPPSGSRVVHKFSTEQKKIGLKIYRLGMSIPDAAYFADIPPYVLCSYAKERGVSIKRSTSLKGTSLTLSLASRVYKAIGKGYKGIDSIAQKVSTTLNLVQVAIENIDKLVPRIIRALRIRYNDPTYSVPYKQSA
ncbi:hypothetical protein HYX02_05840 [Candidatus Woesearchaeota archaeon]|nr:hypothetical protein [Candidatus Woesearchaeota archaeon]